MKTKMNNFIQRCKNLLPDKLYLAIKFRKFYGYWMSFNHPKTFNEKLQWLKLYDKRPIYTTMVDKYAVKKYVADIIGDEYIIPTLGVWNKAEEIEWDKLPNQFVLKCTHDSGGLIICKDKNKLDKPAAIKKLNDCLACDFYMYGRELPYKNVPHRIIAEQYIEPDPTINDLIDYKFFCFDGEVKALFIATERQNPNEEVKFDFFDAEFNHLPLRQGHDNAKTMPQKPKNFELMKQLASKLSKGFPHIRVDFYETPKGVLFGELTLYQFGGFMAFEPAEWDRVFGDWIVLPQK